MIKNGKNPQQLLLSIMQNTMGNTPMGQNLITLAQQGRTADIETIARNIAKSRGIDFDKEFTAFRQYLGV